MTWGWGRRGEGRVESDWVHVARWDWRWIICPLSWKKAKVLSEKQMAPRESGLLDLEACREAAEEIRLRRGPGV
ncbi:unnamed protein product [Prunus armeniaca]|uniref:Uncharacterized protein n=1 Tax=Prunus armeniaca TaxID=36596 RepID=A0A6J5UQQ5_PRUAR|nr:unnamed protein product [Prunus armeniaca]